MDREDNNVEGKVKGNDDIEGEGDIECNDDVKDEEDRNKLVHILFKLDKIEMGALLKKVIVFILILKF